MNSGLPSPAISSSLLGQGKWLAWAVFMVLLLWHSASSGPNPVHPGGHSATLRYGSPVPDQGSPFEQALATAEVESEPGRSKRSDGNPNAATAPLQSPPRNAQVPGEALAFHAQPPRRPLGQAPPPLT